MAATRKLQGEIDRCLKKVAEGVETFEDIWKKVHNATNSNQKEKYEADLKKEIKKLQRLRDQIKSWIASAEIKDKSSLLENRRLIETQMERFKVVERETKTKAYSKEGLGAAQKMDPAQRIKDEARNWLTASISSLQIQIDQYESEIESLLAGKKKRLDRDKQDRMDELRSKLDRHKFHITKLETLLRLLDNDNVEAEQVNKIKDDVEYYIDSSQEPDFEENEFLYDDIIGLDDVELSGTGVSLGVPSSATTDSNNSNETSGSPSSIASGGSPVQSPCPVQQHQQSHNQLTNGTMIQQQQQQQLQPHYNYYSSDSATDALAADKRSKNEINASNKSKQPVKPTAVRAANKTNSSGSLDVSSNKIISSTPSKNHHQQHSTHQQHQQQQHLTLAAVAAAAAAGTAVVNNVHGLTTSSNGATYNSTIHQQQAHATALSLQGPTVAAVSATVGSSSNLTSQSVIQAAPTIAFAAVAKHSTLQNNTSNNSSTVVDTMAHVVQSTISNLSTNVSNCISTNGPTGLQAVNTQQKHQLPQHHQHQQHQSHQQHQQQQMMNININNSTKTARVSPAPSSPKHMNGLPASSVTVNNNSNVDSISLKTIAQEAINRNIIDSSCITQVSSNIDTRHPQQHQQHQQQHSLQQHQQQQHHSLHQQQQQNQQQILQQHFSNDITASNETNPTNVGMAATAASAVTNGPTSVIGVNNTAAGCAVSLKSTALINSTGQHQPSTTTTIGDSNQRHQQQSHTLQLPMHEAHIPPLLGVAPLGPSPLDKDHQLQFQMMEAAYYHLPTPSDSEKLSTYFQRTPVQTPAHYPQQQLPIYDTVEFYQRLSTETLFFVFYYMEGSKAQYLAAKALKKQSWRFHTKYMMWFQRHEEPKVINDDYEQGTYIYFDYEKWSQRKKEGFTFEYKYLEDKELN